MTLEVNELFLVIFFVHFSRLWLTFLLEVAWKVLIGVFGDSIDGSTELFFLACHVSRLVNYLAFFRVRLLPKTLVSMFEAESDLFWTDLLSLSYVLLWF